MRKMTTRDRIKEYVNKNTNWTVRKIQKDLNMSSSSLILYHLRKIKTEKKGKCTKENKKVLFNIITCILKGIMCDEYKSFRIVSYPKNIQVKFEWKGERIEK
jgi:hypothetical protein